MVKRLNKSGFTLVELLATVTVMAILMIVAVPNILNTIDRNKKNTYIEDARKLVNLAKIEFLSNREITRPTTQNGESRCVAFSFAYLVNNKEIGLGPEGGTYDVRGTKFGKDDFASLSYVFIKYDSIEKEYKYGVQLVEEYTTKEGKKYRKGIRYVQNSDDLLGENAINKYIYIDKDLNDGNTIFYGQLNVGSQGLTGCSANIYEYLGV